MYATFSSQYKCRQREITKEFSTIKGAYLHYSQTQTVDEAKYNKIQFDNKNMKGDECTEEQSFLSGEEKKKKKTDMKWYLIRYYDKNGITSLHLQSK